MASTASANMVAMPLTFGAGTGAACATCSSARNGPFQFLGSPDVNDASTSAFAAARGKPSICLSVFSKYSIMQARFAVTDTSSSSQAPPRGHSLSVHTSRSVGRMIGDRQNCYFAHNRLTIGHNIASLVLNRVTQSAVCSTLWCLTYYCASVGFLFGVFWSPPACSFEPESASTRAKTKIQVRGNFGFHRCPFHRLPSLPESASPAKRALFVRHFLHPTTFTPGARGRHQTSYQGSWALPTEKERGALALCRIMWQLKQNPSNPSPKVCFK